MFNHFLSPYISANNIKNQHILSLFSEEYQLQEQTKILRIKSHLGLVESHAQSVWKCFQEKGVLKRIITHKTIVTKHIVLQINPDVTVTENRCCEDHPLKGKYKLSMQIIKPFSLNELKLWCLQSFRMLFSNYVPTEI